MRTFGGRGGGRTYRRGLGLLPSSLGGCRRLIGAGIAWPVGQGVSLGLDTRTKKGKAKTYKVVHDQHSADDALVISAKPNQSAQSRNTENCYAASTYPKRTPPILAKHERKKMYGSRASPFTPSPLLAPTHFIWAARKSYPRDRTRFLSPRRGRRRLQHP